MSVKEMTTVVNAEGQIALPEEIRQALELREGDEVVLALGGFAVKWVSLRAKRADETSPNGVPDAQDFRRAFEEGGVDEYLEEMKRIERASA